MSLRLRPKPPEGLLTINAGRLWSEDYLVPKDMVREASPREIAEYSRREVLEVEGIIAERFG
jgi:hypothetical protein